MSTLPRYALGSRQLRDVIRIDLTFLGATTSNPNSFKLVLLDVNFNQLAIQPKPFDRDIDIPGGLVYNTRWTVPVAGTYYL